MAALIGVAAVTLIYRLLIFRQLFLTDVNITTLALSYLLLVLVIASKRGHGPSIFASLISTFCFNFFFLPPPFTITVQDPHNWVALASFLITAMVASQLWSTARSRTQEAVKSRAEIWRLYQLSRTSIATFDAQTLISSIASKVQDVFHVQYCAVFEPGNDGQWRPLSIASELDEENSFTPSLTCFDDVSLTGKLKSVGLGAEKRTNGSKSEAAGDMAQSGSTFTYLPLHVGTTSIGVMILLSATLEEKTMEAIAGLVAWTLDRARILGEISRTEALEQSNELKAALLASVSHDLRTPLTSIRASVDSLLHSDTKWDETARREFHLIISEEVTRLTRLIENLLAMARIEAGELRPSKKWESISEVCHNVLDRCALAIRNHKVTVECHEMLPAVLIDSRLVAEALSNLIENAAKYSPPGSEIILEAGVKDDQLLLSVTDEGAGVAPEERSRLFEKFYRGTHPQPNGGTGMGLAIARGIIEAHDGRVWVENRSGKGATFKFSLKVEQKPLLEADPTEAE
ncbi:MAG TPA: ATP-binding protein [Terriglobales bacterium]|nr:ATP-binding protein [Terriglobales bacterium]